MLRHDPSNSEILGPEPQGEELNETARCRRVAEAFSVSDPDVRNTMMGRKENARDPRHAVFSQP